MSLSISIVGRAQRPTALQSLRLVLTASGCEPWAVHGLELATLQVTSREAIFHRLLLWKRAVHRMGFDVRFVFLDVQYFQESAVRSGLDALCKICEELDMKIIFELDLPISFDSYFASMHLGTQLRRLGHRIAVRCLLSERLLTIQRALRFTRPQYLVLTGYNEARMGIQREQSKHLTSLSKRFGVETVLLGVDSDFLITQPSAAVSSHLCGLAMVPWEDSDWFLDRP